LQLPDIAVVAFVTVRALQIALSLAVPAPALAADDPSARGMAQRGSFKVVSIILLGPTGGEMKGVWLDGKRGCLDTRTLRVSIQIDLVSPAGKTTRIKRARQGLQDGVRERPLAAGPLRADDPHARRSHGHLSPREPVPPSHAPLLSPQNDLERSSAPRA
jgi:hypothetical protein